MIKSAVIIGHYPREKWRNISALSPTELIECEETGAEAIGRKRKGSKADRASLLIAPEHCAGNTSAILKEELSDLRSNVLPRQHIQ